jgi:YidC/Oxa1 family membrane protein insertase
MIRQGTDGQLPLEVRLEGNGANGTRIDDSSVFYTVEGGDRQLQGEADTTTLTFRGTLPNGTPIAKIFSFSAQSYGIQLVVQAESVPQAISQLSLVWIERIDRSKPTSAYATDGPVALLGRKFVYESASGLKEGETVGPGQVRWAGYTDSYFLAAMMPPEGDNYTSVFSVANDTVRTSVTIPWNGEAVPYLLYIGPKETAALNETDPAFDRAIDFGWFHFIASPLMSLLRLSHAVTGNYGIDIILLTILVKLLFFPLSNKSFKSMAAMKKLQPQMERLREQYGDDRQKLNQETMELYKRHKVNPLGGCLPMLVQFPVFIGLYQGLMHAIELRQAPFFGWISDLSQPDRLGSLALPFVDPPGLPVLTLVMGGSMLLQQWMTPMTVGDPMQQKMMMLMPVVFTVMFVNFPAGLVLYWLVNNVLSITQQYWYNSQQEQTA